MKAAIVLASLFTSACSGSALTPDGHSRLKFSRFRGSESDPLPDYVGVDPEVLPYPGRRRKYSRPGTP
jgi:hypothetical protein